MFQRLIHVAAALAALPLIAAMPASAGCGHGTCYEKVHTPDVYATVAQPVVIAPARAHVVHSPALYGTVNQTVQVAPARAYTSYTQPVYAHAHKEVVVHPGGYRWQHTVDHRGRERLCKVYVPAATRTVHERVLVEPSQRVTHVVPAVYQNVQRTVVVKPATAHTVYQPPVYGYRHYNVRVQRGHAHWVRSW